MSIVARLLEPPGGGEAKPGLATSEFWLTVLGMVATILGVVAGFLPPEWAAVALAIQKGTYDLSRGWTKSGAAKADAMVQVAKAEVVKAEVIAATPRTA